MDDLQRTHDALLRSHHRTPAHALETVRGHGCRPLTSDDALELIRRLRQTSNDADELALALIDLACDTWGLSRNEVCSATGTNRVTHRKRAAQPRAQTLTARLTAVLRALSIITPPPPSHPETPPA